MDVIEVQLATFHKNDNEFYFSILDVNNFGDFDRSLFHIGKRWDEWFLELFFIRVLPT